MISALPLRTAKLETKLLSDTREIVLRRQNCDRRGNVKNQFDGAMLNEI